MRRTILRMAEDKENKKGRTSRGRLWHELLVRKVVVLTALVILFLSSASWLWDEVYSPLQRPRLIEALHWFPWYVWVIVGFVVLIGFIGEHAYKLIHVAEQGIEDMKANLQGALEMEQAKHKVPDLHGSIFYGYIDATKFIPTLPNELQKLEKDSYISCLLIVTNHSECSAYISKISCRVKMYGIAYEGTFESCPMGLTLSVDEPAFQEKRMTDFFANIWHRHPMERGIPHQGWMRFLVKDFGIQELTGRDEVPATIEIELEDTLGKHHLITSEARPLLLKTGRVKLTVDLIKPPLSA
jgi:hypothetical protein